MANKDENKNFIYKIGRRKTATASVRLYKTAGESIVNNKTIESLNITANDREIIAKPFQVLELDSKNFYFTAQIKGGGVTAQLEALSLALSRALVAVNPDSKLTLRANGLLTRDSRMVERKKTGLRKARKKEQYSKR